MIGRALALLFLDALALGCRITPPARFYALTSLAPPGASSSSLFITVGPVSVPSAVDRSEMVVSAGANEVRLDEFHRWAASLEDNVSRVVAQNLATMLGTPRVVLSGEAPSGEPDYRVTIEILGFNSSLGRFAALDAVWTVRRGGNGPSEMGRTLVQENVGDRTYEALVAAHSRAVERMSRQVADAVERIAERRDPARAEAHH